MLYALAFVTLLLQVQTQLPVQDRDTAPMIELSKADAASALEIHNRVAQTEKDWEAIKLSIIQKYTLQGRITFSRDYRFAVGSGYPPAYVELTAEETARARSAHQASLQAQQDRKDLRERIVDKYLRAPLSETDVAFISNIRVRRDYRDFIGGPGFVFTKDCRFILPYSR